MSKIKNNTSSAWNNYYLNDHYGDLSPTNELVNFFSHYILKEPKHKTNNDILTAQSKKVIDVGCGTGSNLLLGNDMGLEMYGIDISDTAVEITKTDLENKIGSKAKNRLFVGDIITMPWTDCFFSHAISINTLDSMRFESAQAGVPEIARVIKKGGYFFCSLISRDSLKNSSNFCGEEFVQSGPGTQTVISYFNRTKVWRLIEPLFEILSCDINLGIHPRTGSKTSQWQIVSKRR